MFNSFLELDKELESFVPLKVEGIFQGSYNHLVTGTKCVTKDSLLSRVYFFLVRLELYKEHEL